MVEALLAGDPWRALAWNPLLFVVLAGVAAWAAASALRFTFSWPVWRPELEPAERRIGWVIGLSIVTAGWLYLVFRGV
jgi:hypothetical protein